MSHTPWKYDPIFAVWGVGSEGLGWPWLAERETKQ